MSRPLFSIGDNLRTYRVITWSTRPVQGDGGREYFNFIVKDIKYGLMSNEPYYVDDNGKRYAEDKCKREEKENECTGPHRKDDVKPTSKSQ